MATFTKASCLLIFCLDLVARAAEDVHCLGDGRVPRGTQANGLLNVAGGNVIHMASTLAKPKNAPWDKESAIEKGDSGTKLKIKPQPKAVSKDDAEEGDSTLGRTPKEKSPNTPNKKTTTTTTTTTTVTLALDENNMIKEWHGAHESALAYLQAFGDVGSFKDFSYLNMFEDKILVSNPVGADVATTKTQLSTSISSMRAIIAPLGFDIMPRVVTVAQNPTFAAAYSTVTITGSNISFDRADVLQFSKCGKIESVSAYWHFAGSALSVKSKQHSVTSRAIHKYLIALHELGTGKSDDYFRQFADEFEVHDPFGTDPVLTMEDLGKKISGLAAVVAPQGFEVKTRGVTVAADERFGSAHLELKLLHNGQEIPIIDIFEISADGKIMNLKAVWHIG